MYRYVIQNMNRTRTYTVKNKKKEITKRVVKCRSFLHLTFLIQKGLIPKSHIPIYNLNPPSTPFSFSFYNPDLPNNLRPLSSRYIHFHTFLTRRSTEFICLHLQILCVVIIGFAHTRTTKDQDTPLTDPDWYLVDGYVLPDPLGSLDDPAWIPEIRPPACRYVVFGFFAQGDEYGCDKEGGT